MEDSTMDTPPNQDVSSFADYLIVISIDKSPRKHGLGLDALSWVMTNCFSGELLRQREIVFSSERGSYSSGDISFCKVDLLVLNAQAINLFNRVISEIQEEYEKNVMSTKKTPYVVLADQETAYVLLNCFKQVGIRVPSCLLRVYLLQVEYARFNQQTTPSLSTDSVLVACNNRTPSSQGLARCMDIKDAFLSLQQKGHFLNPSSRLLLIGYDLKPIRFTEGQRRHLSMDASPSFSIRENPKDLSSSSKYLSPSSQLDSSSLFYSQTPLLRSSPFLESLQPDDIMPEFSLTRPQTSRPPSWASNHQSLLSFNSSDMTDPSLLRNPSELWKEPSSSILNWQGNSLELRQSFDSSTSHTSLLAPLSSELKPLDSNEQPSRSNSLTLNPDFQEYSPFTYSFVTPQISSLKGQNEVNDGFSLLHSSVGNVGTNTPTGMNTSSTASLAGRGVFSRREFYEETGSPFKAPSNRSDMLPDQHQHEFLLDSQRPDNAVNQAYSENHRNLSWDSNHSEFLINNHLGRDSTDSTKSYFSVYSPYHGDMKNKASFGDMKNKGNYGDMKKAMNPNSAEFVPSFLQHPHEEKRVSKRDKLEEVMLLGRIEENHIVTLKLRGLPYSATKEEIASFFSPLEIPHDKEGGLSIVIGQDNLQRPSGEAFVTFASVEDCMTGLTYHMKHLGKRYIEIFPLFNKEYYKKNAIYCTICNKYGHTDESCLLRNRIGHYSYQQDFTSGVN